MAIKITQPTRESYVEALCDAADEIILRAEEIIGESNGIQRIDISFSIIPHEITNISIKKEILTGWRGEN